MVFSLFGEGVKGVAVPGGDMASRNVSASEGRDFGVRVIIVLLFDNGRGLDVA